MNFKTPNLASHHVTGSRDTFYIPNFITLEEEEYLIRKILESPQPKWKSLQNRRLQIWGGELTSKSQLIPQPFPSYLVQYPDIIGRIRDTGAFSGSPHGEPNHIILNEYLPGQGIMPHEDGPSYHPVVATLSLGSHAVFHYHQYKGQAHAEQGNPAAEDGLANGRSIDPMPILSLLLEPRSLVITTSELYDAHLHGIQDIPEDVFTPPQAPDITNASGTLEIRPQIANASQLKGKEFVEAVSNGGTLMRGVRYSLTCRDVERVAKLNARTMTALGLVRH